MTRTKIPNRPSKGLYVHVPFCTQRCIYCDFYFVTSSRGRNRFVDALCAEITQSARKYAHTPVGTVYFGGGTPSRLPGAAVARIMRTISDAFDTRTVREITLEVNPEDVTEAYLNGLKACGVTRLSVGIQSFHASDLEFLNRAHGVSGADRAIELVGKARFDSWTMDLIFGLPDQTLARWEANLARAVDADPPHISAYNLTIEPRTPLHNQVRRGLVRPADDEDVARAYQVAIESLGRAGYSHYEISSFARPDHAARHNQAYWKHSNYLGFGPSAHSFWWDESGARRWGNVASLKAYTDRVLAGTTPEGFSEVLTQKQLATERIMLGLRTSDGISIKTLKENYYWDLVCERRTQLTQLLGEGLVERDEDRLRLTVAGRHVCDRVTATLVPD